MKVHGDAHDRGARVLTSSEYERFYGAAEPLQGVLSFLLTRPLLFLGCSLDSDRTVGVIGKWAAAHAISALHFAVLPRPNDDSELHRRNRFLSEMSVLPIWYPTDRHEAVTDLLRTLAEDVSTDRTEGPSGRVTGAVRSPNSPACETVAGPANRPPTAGNLPVPARSIVDAKSNNDVCRKWSALGES